MIARADFIVAVRSCIGTPVVHMGRVIGDGLDCVGLPWAAARVCGADLPPTRRYQSWPSADELTAGLQEFCEVCEPADAHLLQVYAGKQARHIVVPVSMGRIVHAWGKASHVVEVPMTERIARGWRIRGID